LRRQPLALVLGACFLLVAPRGLVRRQLLANIVDLLVETFQFILARRKLRLQLRRSLLSFRRSHDGLTNVQHGYLAGAACTRCRLSTNGCRAQKAQGGRRSHSNHVSRIHCFLLIRPRPCLIPGGLCRRDWHATSY
jgi:hypothetical protein